MAGFHTDRRCISGWCLLDTIELVRVLCIIWNGANRSGHTCNPPMQSDQAHSCWAAGAAVGARLGVYFGVTVGDDAMDVGFTDGKAVGVCDGLLEVG